MDFFLQDGMGPFTFFATLVVGFLLLEVLFVFIGITTQIGGDADAGLEIDADASMGDMPELEVDVPDGVEIVNDAPESSGPTTAGGILDILGMRKLPLTVWLALFSAFFAGLGIALQSTVHGIFGFALPAELAATFVMTPTLFLTRTFAEAISNRIPQMETSSVSELSLGRRKGVITVGVSRRGYPAQVRVSDRHGNLHYIMVEPLADEEIPQGTEVLIVRVRDKNEPKMVYRLVPDLASNI